MNFAAIIGMLLPLLTNFLKGKSGDDLSGMLTNNQDMITKLLSGLGNNGGNLGGLGGLGQLGNIGNGDSASSILSTIMPVLLKQQPVVLVPNGNTPLNQPEPDGAIVPSAVVNDLEARIANLERSLATRK